MIDYILQTNGLTKNYPHTKALDHINISIQKGKIYGFIGQNGAGKTTFMRIICGLTFADQGNIQLFGKSGEQQLAKLRKRIGSMIDGPAFFPDMTASQNLEAVRLLKGIPNQESIPELLALTGLEQTGKKKVRDFSTGMKQRLGIAAALLGEPDFLMLDEPTNGLDPISIVEIRKLLLHLAEEKQMTIMVSSHILEELYQLVTDYLIIHNGRLIQELTKKQLDERCQKHISIEVDDVPHASAVLENKLKTRNYQIMPDDSIHLYDFLNDMSLIIQTFTTEKLLIQNISVEGDSLENYFIHLIGGIS